MASREKIFAYLSIFALPVLYGGFYLATQEALHDVSIFWLNFFRMAVAFLGFLPFLSKLKNITKPILRANLIVGLVLFFGILVQSLALFMTSISNTGFLAALFILFTPLLQKILFRKKITPWLIFPVFLSLFGYYWMFRDQSTQSFTFGWGDFFAVLGALTIALHMVLTEHFIGDNDPIQFVLLQTILNLGLFAICGLIFDPLPLVSTFSGSTWGYLAYLGIGATVLPLVLQNWGQKQIPSTQASLIVALEPVFASLFAFLFIHDPITSPLLLGGVCILGGAMCSILLSSKMNPKNSIL